MEKGFSPSIQDFPALSRLLTKNLGQIPEAKPRGAHDAAMPLHKGKQNVAENIREFHTGKTYARTKARYGKAVADKQAIAAAIHAATGKKSKKRSAR